MNDFFLVEYSYSFVDGVFRRCFLSYRDILSWLSKVEGVSISRIDPLQFTIVEVE